MKPDRMSYLPRWLHRFYAWLGGYFWLPCHLCGRNTGGHEWKDRNGLSSSVTTEVRPGGRTGKGICPACTRAGKGDQSWGHD